CFTFSPRPIETSLTAAIALPCAVAVTEVADWPPSNWMMLASMQCLAKRPSSFATYGAVCTTFGGAEDTPTSILRIVGQLCASASVWADMAQNAARDRKWSQPFDMAGFLLLVVLLQCRPNFHPTRRSRARRISPPAARAP